MFRIPFLLAAAAIAVGVVDASACGLRRATGRTTVRVTATVRSCGSPATASPCRATSAETPAACPGGQCPSLSISVDVGGSPQPFGRLLSLHNAERSRRGLGSLSLDLTLCQGAQQAAQAQAERRQCGHFLPLAGAAAENAAAGQPSEEAAHSSWVASAGHYANIVGPYSRVGFGLVDGPNGPYWAARFGR